MILELKSGSLVIDSSCNLADAHLVIETPFGRMIKEKSLTIGLENSKENVFTLK